VIEVGSITSEKVMLMFVAGLTDAESAGEMELINGATVSVKI
jgi:hypothetical protein